MKILAVVAAAISAILLFLLASASANTALFASNYPLLLGLNLVIAVSLLALVIVQLRTMWREYRERVFGSRLKSRLLLMLALMAVLPGALVYAVSLQFAMSSIESWFDVRVDSALEGGLNLGRNVLDSQLTELASKARGMALELGDGDESGAVRATRLNRLREQAGVKTATLLSASGQVLASSLGGLDKMLPDLPSPAQLRQGRQNRGMAQVEGDASSGLTLRVLVPVTSSELNIEARVLQLTQSVPPSIAQSAASVEAAYRDYQQLSLSRQGLKHIYTLTLTLTLLLALFAAIALAFFLAKRLVAPLLILAEGTQAVAAGDFSPRAALETHDELGVLTQSFNQMTRQLDEARRETERHRGEVEAARAYLASVLANLSTGVLAFDSHFVLRAANRGASAILRDTLVNLEGKKLSDWPGHAALSLAIRDSFSGTDHDAGETREWQRQVDIEHQDGSNQVLLLRGSTLPQGGGGGFVVVFDDITQLIAAQRSAAWGEVARRLAHEIKNPLTPIQLSAERLQQKLADKLDPEAQLMLDRATQTIVNQVEAMKNMVNSFRDYARTPPAQLQPLDLNALVTEILGLYETSHAHLVTDLTHGLPSVLGDATQLRQVIHNLLTNAEEAAEDGLGKTEQTEILIVTQAAEKKSGVLLSVRDNGNGFPAHILANAFEPYVTTKSKGSGLGLAIVKKIVDEHNGEVRIANLQPHGAEVTIRLPLAAVRME
ncbi:MAG: HAMP domain-containing protein [Betaproteobacteria bacterium]|nr:HAMP domain-containing protein [Betaproteobacteria bacterium]